jgi:molybdopterin molybdotransferase
MHLADPPQRHAADQLPLIVEALAGMADLDIICLSGGVSVGRYDLVPQALVEYGGEAVFHGVRQKPAKPLLFARKGRQLLVGLPGNPLACHLGFERYVSAAIRKMSGRPAPAPQFQGELQQAIQPKKDRTHFVPARAEWSPGPATPWRLTLLPGNSSADLLAGCGANCYVELPPGADTAQAGRLCTFSWFEGGGAVAGPLFDPRGVGAISPAVALRDPGSADP